MISMMSIVDAIKERRRQKKVEKKKDYDYSKDINRDGCIHRRTKIFNIKPKWETGTASIIIECKDCTKIGLTDGTIDYYDGDVEWQK